MIRREDNQSIVITIDYSVLGIHKRSSPFLTVCNFRSEHEGTLKEKSLVIDQLRQALEELKCMYLHSNIGSPIRYLPVETYICDRKRVLCHTRNLVDLVDL